MFLSLKSGMPSSDSIKNIKDFYENELKIHAVIGDKTQKVLKILRLSRFKTVLDIGCGDAAFDAIILKEFPESCLCGIDISHEAITMAAKKGIDTIELDVSKDKLPFEDNRFDIILMLDVIEHVLDPDFTITEVHRVLKNSGKLILSTPNMACWLNRFCLLIGLQPIFTEVSTNKVFGRKGKQVVGHLRLFVPKALDEFLSFYHFNISKKYGCIFELLPFKLRPIDRFFSNFYSFSSILLVIAEKL